MPSCCYLNDKGNEILFRINISPPLIMITRLDGVGHWFGLPGYRTSHHWTSSYGATLKPWFTFHQLILKRILLPVLLRQQQPGMFERNRQSRLYRRLCIQVVAVCLNICSELLWNTTFFSEYLSGFAWFPTLVWPNLTVRSTARMLLRHIVPWQ